MELQEVIDQFRSDVSDESDPKLFSDDEVLRWLIDAQDMFVRLTNGIADAQTAAITDLQLSASEPYTAFSPYILRIRSGSLQTAKIQVKFIHEADLDHEIVRDYGFTTIQKILDDTDTGAVTLGILGLTDKKIRWVKVPLTDDVCKIHVYRLPYPRIKTTDDCLEIGEQHHIHLIKWMKHMAYAKEDAETYDKELSQGFFKEFHLYVDLASRELERERFKPKQVRYGGIRF